MSGGYMFDYDIRCKDCGKLLGKVVDNVLEVKNGNKSLRVYGAVAVSIECERCGKTHVFNGAVLVTK